jgi:probable rRNA maturation factor
MFSAQTMNNSVSTPDKIEIYVALHDMRWKSAIENSEAYCKQIITRVLEAFPEHWRHRTVGPDGKQYRMEVACILSEDTEIAGLNERFRGKSKPTNVLSFVADPDGPLDDDIPVVLGDIIVSYDTIVKEAMEQNKPLRHHFTHILVHGIMHLIGFDHVQDDEAEIMERYEKDILAELNIPDPYQWPTEGGEQTLA